MSRGLGDVYKRQIEKCVTHSDKTFIATYKVKRNIQRRHSKKQLKQTQYDDKRN